MMWLIAQTSQDVTPPDDTEASIAYSALDLLNSYAWIFIAAFVVTLLVTPIIRRLAIAQGVVDHPDQGRKQHREPIAYLGGLAVFLGLTVAIACSYLMRDVSLDFVPVPMAVVLGMFAITLTGLADDIWGWDPRLKIAGQLVAAAALAIEEVGVRVAAGLLEPIAKWVGLDPALQFVITMPFGMGDMTFDLIYWVGTAIIAVFVLGGCNAANLIDGLDGLLSGVVAICATGLLAVAVIMALYPAIDLTSGPVDTLGGARIILCFALLGAVLGFLPHNFNPASIFLGDAGSLLLGYMCIVIILMLGEHGQTHLVFAGLIIFAVPIMDTILAIVRRKLSGRSMSAADDQHIHHQLKRSLGGVKRAVFAIYGIGFAFAVVGVTLAALVMLTDLRTRVVYAIAMVLFSFIGVIAFKAVRKRQVVTAGASETVPAKSRSNHAGNDVPERSSSSQTERPVGSTVTKTPA